MRLLIGLLIVLTSLFAIEVQTKDDRGISLKLKTFSWNTNWNKHTINYDELLSGGPSRDGIPPIDKPKFVSTNSAKLWLRDNEPLIFLKIDNRVKAYPLQVLMWHEIVNDELSNKKITVTFCPLCNASIVFDRELNGKTYDFGTSGLLRNSDLVMYDRQTESLWQQLTGEGIVGDEVNKKLTMLPSQIISFKDLYTSYPTALVLSKNTGHNRDYGRNPYIGYDDINQSPFLLKEEADGRLKPMRRVTAIEYEGVSKAYPFNILKDKKVVNDSIKDLELVLFYGSKVASALNASFISSSKDSGTVTAYTRELEGKKLNFYFDGAIKDKETNSTWNIFGQAISGELKGKSLKAINAGSHFWFAWAVFKPETIIYK